VKSEQYFLILAAIYLAPTMPKDLLRILALIFFVTSVFVSISQGLPK
jgi:hypothetical protein